MKLVIIQITSITLFMFSTLSALAAPKPILIECRSFTSRLQAATPRLVVLDAKTFQVYPVEPEPTPVMTAPVMDLPVHGSFQYPRSHSKFDIQFKYSVSQLQPKFTKTGEWLNSYNHAKLSLHILVREISLSGKITAIGGTSVSRFIHFDEHGLHNNNDIYLSGTVYSPKIYQLAFDFPNNLPSNVDFPHSHYDIDWNKKIREMLNDGTLAHDEFVSFGVTCGFRNNQNK